LKLAVKSRFNYRWYHLALLIFLISVVGINGIAWMQAYSMTHYAEGGKRTLQPEKLSFIDKVGVVLTGVRFPRPQNRKTPQDINLRYETHHISISQHERLEAWFVPVKSPKGIVVLFPPYGASKQALLSPSQILHDLDYDTLMVDFRGAGGSSGSDTTLGIREASDVVRAIAYVRQKWPDRPIILYGASMGASAVMRAIALEGVAPVAIIIESPFDRLLHTVRHRFEAMGIPSFPASELIVWWGGWQQGIDGFAHNPVEYAKKIECPVLLMYGTRDGRVTLAEVESIFHNIRPRKQLVLFSAVGHGSLASDDPIEWKKQVQQFLLGL
jgi:uncharacterized protein